MNRTKPISGLHDHVWIGQGLVREDRLSASPVSHFDCQVYTVVSSVELCACGEHRKVKVAHENVRTGGDVCRAFH